MDSKRLIELRAARGAKNIGSDVSQKSIEFVVNDCRRFIQDKSEEYRNLDSSNKRNTIKDLIIKYVMNNAYLVEGYVDEDNKLDTNKLIDNLVEDITDHGILTAPIEDPEVYEIRCNGKEIKIEKEGRMQDLRDKDGNIVSFESTDQQDIVLRRLLGDVRLTPKDALVNARTMEGFRIAAVHSSAIGDDPNDPTGDKYHAFVLRKFKALKMGLPDIVKKQTLSDNMARLLGIIPGGGLTFLTVGPTASGKTTTNNAILQATPPDLRTILIQNPSEIDLRMRDPSNRVYNDVLHLEAKDIDNPTSKDATMQNLMNHILRLSPTLAGFGEIRTNGEFKLAMQIMQAGHPVNATYHAEGTKGAVDRFLTAYLAESGNEPYDLALRNLVRLLNIVIVQKVMKDGFRRVLQISELVGIDPTDENKPLINDLFLFEPDGKVDYDEHGAISMIHGSHRRVGKLSEKTIRKLKIEGISESRYDFLLKDPSDNEVETYTGENILEYGMNTRKVV